VQVFINSINNQNGLTKNPIHLLSIELKIAVFLLSFRKQLKNHTVKNIFLFNNRYFILAITILICSACDSSNPVKEKAPANENEELRRKELELKERELNIREKELSQKEEEIAPKSKAKESPYKSSSPSEEDFYIINVSAIKDAESSRKKVDELRSMGYESDYLWIPDYNSLSGAEYYSVYIGPFFSQYECEEATEAYRHQHPEAYGLLVSQKNVRVRINGIGKIIK
jgi:hypothetical protein